MQILLVSCKEQQPPEWARNFIISREGGVPAYITTTCDVNAKDAAGSSRFAVTLYIMQVQNIDIVRHADSRFAIAVVLLRLLSQHHLLM